MDVVLAIALASAASLWLFLSLLFIAYFKLCNRDNRDVEQGHSGSRVAAAGLDPPAAAKEDSVCRFKSSEIDTLASNFTPSTVIGEGGFSTVYVASLQDSRFSSPLVAIKVHNSSQRLHRAFRQELDILLHVKHPHIVRLLGYCDDRDEGVLVFEYVPNGTLHDILHNCGGRDLNSVLPWTHRTSILFYIATALDYLHEGCELQIIHGDIKSSNVLLDDNLKPKLCDFGSSRMGFSATVTRSANQMMGSLGYVDPYYLRTGMVSKKSDVYSFGVLILELITGIEAFDPEKEQLLTTVLGSILSVDAEAKIRSRKFVDPKLGDEYDVNEVLTMTAIAAQCTAEQLVLRPSMADVVKTMREKVCIIPKQDKPDM